MPFRKSVLGFGFRVDDFNLIMLIGGELSNFEL